MKAILIYLILLTTVAAATKSERGLLIIAESLLIPTNADATKGLLDIQVYLKNAGEEPQAVVVGDVVKTSSSGEAIAFTVTLERTAQGGIGKPTLQHLNVIVLRKGELVKLRSVRLPVSKGDSLERRISYSVEDALGTFYEVWTGHVSGRALMTTAAP